MIHGWSHGPKVLLSDGPQVSERIKQWIAKGNPNVKHYDALLDAELAAIQGRWSIARNRYEVAILFAGRQGFVHEQALAHERYAGQGLQHGWRSVKRNTQQARSGLGRCTFRSSLILFHFHG